MDGSSPFDPSATPRPGALKPPADLPGAHMILGGLKNV